jgi:hypothetical protein
MNNDEKIIVAWCDSGRVEGTFAVGLHHSIINTDINNQFTDFIRSKGMKIATQRQEVFDRWMLPEFDYSDWILFIDSDMEINYNMLKKLIDSADKDIRPVMSALCFTVTGEQNNGISVPKAAYFYKNLETNDYRWGNLNENKGSVFEVDAVGFGMILIHRSVAKKLVNRFKNSHLFLERQDENNHSNFVGEDIVFCEHLKEINIPIHINTDVVPRHWKTIPIDQHYYKLYYESKAAK